MEMQMQKEHIRNMEARQESLTHEHTEELETRDNYIK